MNTIFEILAKPLSDFFRIKHVAIFQLDSSKAALNLAYSCGFSLESIHSLQDLKEKADVFKRVTETRIPQIVNDISVTEESLSFLKIAEGINSLIAVPVFSKDKMWGILVAFSQGKSEFKEDDAKIMTLFGGQIGELLQLFSSSLQDNLDGLLVQILGAFELLKFKYRNRDNIPVSEILDTQARWKNMILSYVADLEQKSGSIIVAEEKTKKKKPPLPTSNELEIEEVISIQGEKWKSPKKKKVLVIDDQPIVTDLLVSVLERMNYESVVASCGTEGVEKFEKDDFDLVITDLGMPDLSGWEVSKAVKQNKPDVPVIVVTGWGVDPDPNKMKGSKVDYLINKPFQIDQLEKIIKDLLEK